MSLIIINNSLSNGLKMIIKSIKNNLDRIKILLIKGESYKRI